MNDIFITTSANKTAAGINKYALYQSESQDIVDAYQRVFDNVEGSMTTVSDNDTNSKFKITATKINLEGEQQDVFDNVKSCFLSIEKTIDPSRLNFNIGVNEDNDICISRASDCGIATLIIHGSGLIAHSFISYPHINEGDFLIFHENDVVDFESLTYNFFAS